MHSREIVVIYSAELPILVQISAGQVRTLCKQQFNIVNNINLCDTVQNRLKITLYPKKKDRNALIYPN